MRNAHFEQGTFFVGCNYWASHAGMRMWSMWDEATVEDDLRRLSEHGIRTLRVFPLWSDFQPLRMHLGGSGVPREVRLGEKPLDFTPEGRAGVDPVMMDRFQRFCDLAEKYGLRLIVGLLTGWMSGRLFVPEMIQGRNPLTDPFAIKWEIKFVRYFVRRFRAHPAVLAWDLGNECNCMGSVSTDAEAYVWASTISLAIRAEDGAHLIVSGMHGLKTEGTFRMQDQGEFLDVLCTHPYPIFTPHCDTDPLNHMKSPLHATAQSRFFADIGGKQCFAEETGVLGPMVISDERAADYIRMTLFTLLAHDCRGMLWWCAFEQSALTLTPYDWNGVERELGLFYADKTEKPVLKEISRFGKYCQTLPFDHLPPPVWDAVCILTHDQDCWAAAYGAFIMAVQAGLNLRFAWVDGEIPDAPAYLLPDLEGDRSVPRHVMLELLDRVQRGAKLYLSMDGPLLSPFSAFSGVRVLSRAHQPGERTVRLEGRDMPMERGFQLEMESVDAQVLARTAEGDIAFSRNAYGAGEVYVLAFPAEKAMAVQPGIVDAVDRYPYYLFYQAMNLRRPERTAQCPLSTVGVTEHVVSEREHILSLINYTPLRQSAPLQLAPGWRVAEVYAYDPQDRVTDQSADLAANGGVLVRVCRE